MREFVGNDGSTQNLQALAIRNCFERAIIDISNQLGTDEHAHIEPQSGEPPYKTKDPIGPVGSLQRHAMIVHENPQERGMTLLLADKQFNYPKQVRHLFFARESFRRSQERPPLRLFAELKRCDGACNELPFIAPQNIAEALRNTARTQRMMFEMIRPDLEISATHAATLLIAQAKCESSIGRLSGGIRAHCGSG
jgi:hypothetical protein